MERFLLWICSWSQMFEGLAGVLTFGYWRPNWAIKSAKKLTRWRARKWDGWDYGGGVDDPRY